MSRRTGIFRSVFRTIGSMTGKVKTALIMIVMVAVMLRFGQLYLARYDPLFSSIEEDPCFQNGVYYIGDIGDYLRFVGYLNRAHKEEEGNEKATAVDAVLTADICLTDTARGPWKLCPLIKGDIIPYRFQGGHPYIRQSILDYAGTFDGNGHTITWKKDSGNGMFVSISREGMVKNLTFHAESLRWDMDEYGVGMICMINYGTIQNCRTEGSLEGTECYAGGIAGINRGVIEDCVNTADIRVPGVGDYGAGGIAGLSKCKVLPGESEETPIVPVIKGCINDGRIEGTWCAGGICARNDCADIYSCGNTGEVQVKYQRGYIYPEHPEWYECALAAGICADMGWNSIKDCYNQGKISIAEEGNEATYGIAGNTLLWSNSVTNCVNLKGTATGNMRHESVMELDEEELMFWMENPEQFTYIANNWKFDLEEAREKLPLVPLGVEESERTKGREDVWLCDEFYLRAPDGYTVKEVSPYALCMEDDAGESPWGDNQIWLLRLEEHLVNAAEYLDANGNFVEETAHEVWKGIPGSHWLHPGYSYKDDCHVQDTSGVIGERRYFGGIAVVHYRDDFLAALAVGTEDGGKMDNIAALPMCGSGYELRWLLLFTRAEDNNRPGLDLVRETLGGFLTAPGWLYVAWGDTLSGIAGQCTGDSSRYPELAVYNEITDADHIEAGQVLLLPPEWLQEF